MLAPLEDKLAMEFSRGFYDALAAGQSIDFAYQEGRRCMQLIAGSSENLPILVRQSVLQKYQLQPLGMRTNEYECWYTQLKKNSMVS